ncbi:MAG: MaoC family dehydratase [Gemmatimonadaceae bacterium]
MRYDELETGQHAELTRTVSLQDIEAFAAVTGDVNPVHLDDDVAARTRFGGRIAHGMLSAGFVSAVLGTQLPGPGVVYLTQSLRFVRPVRPGDVITARVEVLELLATKRRLRLTTVCRNQRDEIVLDGEALCWLPEDPA